MLELPDPETIYDDARSFLADMIQGDMAVRKAGLALATGSSGIPALLVCRRVRGKLCFELTIDTKKRFLFGLFKKKRENQLATLRVYLQIEPVVEPEPAIGVPRSTYIGPDFLVATGEQSSFRLRLPDGGIYDMSFKDRRAILTHTVTGVSSNGRKGEPAPVLKDVLMTLRDWMLRKKDTESIPLPRSVAAQASRMVGLLGQAALGLSRLTSSQAVEPGETARRLGDIHPDLAPRYWLDWLELRLLTRVNSAGAIVLNPKRKTPWLQVDVQAKLHRHGDMAEVRHSLYLPDFLVVGNKYHSVFVDALREDSALELLHKAINGDGDSDHLAAIRSFVCDGVDHDDIVIARVKTGTSTGRGDKVDRDLVVLREREHGTRWLVLLIAFRCASYPDVDATVVKVECVIGGELGGKAIANKPPRVVADYLYRLLKVLTAWRDELSIVS